MEDIVIVGSGPAGLTAAIYAARGGFKPLVIEGMDSGGQLMQTAHVANFPGFGLDAKGPDIIAAIRSQAENAGTRFKMDVVESVDFSGPVKVLNTMMGEKIESKSVIIATGAGVSKTGKPGEARFWGHGISACLTCDGAFYSGKRVAVIGSDSSAQGAKKYLERLGAEVAAIVSPENLVAFNGEGNTLTAIEQLGTVPNQVPVDGAFLVTARVPQTSFLKGALELDSAGYVVINGVNTSIPGVFAAGDCARPHHKQAIVASGDGAIAALEAMAYVRA